MCTCIEDFEKKYDGDFPSDADWPDGWHFPVFIVFKKDGEIVTRVRATHCPFCGDEYDERDIGQYEIWPELPDGGLKKYCPTKLRS